MHITSTHIWTALAASALSLVLLKFLKVFHFIRWSPIGWSKRIYAFTDAPDWAKWVLIGAVCFIFFFLLYMIALFTANIPITLTSLLFTVLAVVSVEWMIYAKPDLTVMQFMKKLSIPFACLFAIVIRFVVGTSVYMKNTFE